MEKTPIIAGNWKMNKSSLQATEFIKNLAPKISEYNSLVYLAVPFTYINKAAQDAKDTKIIIGAQNMNDAEKGAFTGEISALMIKEAGAEFVILGHSERRHIFKETDLFINKKLLRAIKDDIKPIFCIGETLEENEANQTKEVLKKQLENGLKAVSIEDIENVIIAYEPVWAIGTGKTASSDIAENCHEYIREVLSDLFGKDVAKKIYILYGGSVKPNNVNEILSKKNIDGVLVGGAALEVDSFYNIIKNA